MATELMGFRMDPTSRPAASSRTCRRREGGPTRLEYMAERHHTPEADR
jgi:hypothetical protein